MLTDSKRSVKFPSENVKVSIDNTEIKIGLKVFDNWQLVFQ